MRKKWKRRRISQKSEHQYSFHDLLLTFARTLPDRSVGDGKKKSKASDAKDGVADRGINSGKGKKTGKDAKGEKEAGSDKE